MAFSCCWQWSLLGRNFHPARGSRSASHATIKSARFKNLALFHKKKCWRSFSVGLDRRDEDNEDMHTNLLRPLPPRLLFLTYPGVIQAFLGPADLPLLTPPHQSRYLTHPHPNIYQNVSKNSGAHGKMPPPPGLVFWPKLESCSCYILKHV